MFDFKQVGRLLRQDWDNPTDLARELYGLFTNKDARTINQPLSIEVPKGQAGLSISRESASPSSAIRPSVTTLARPNRPPIPETIKPDIFRSDLVSDRTIKDAPDLNFPRPPELDGGGPPIPEGEIFRPTSGNWSAPQGVRPSSSNRQNRPSQVQSGPDFSPVRPDVPSSNPSKAYSKPVFEASGEIRFSGITPVQFDTPPRVFNPTTDNYEPYNFNGQLTRIPLNEDDGATVMWGQVVSGQGDTYLVNLFTDPDPETQPTDSVSVEVVGLDDKEVIPPLTWLYPVTPNADGNAWYSLAPMWL
jgi:hypothetical protein